MEEPVCYCPLDGAEEAKGRQSERALKLQAEGWQMEFSYAEPQLSRRVKIYEDMGYQVRLEAMLPVQMEAGVCAECKQGYCKKYKTIYTREL